jgi:hypothetical protein
MTAASLAPRVRSLARWNRFLTVLHGGQFVLMLAVLAIRARAFAGKCACPAPVVPSRPDDLDR